MISKNNELVKHKITGNNSTLTNIPNRSCNFISLVIDFDHRTDCNLKGLIKQYNTDQPIIFNIVFLEIFRI